MGYQNQPHEYVFDEHLIYKQIKTLLYITIFIFQWFAIMISVNGLLQITNCTVNYIIYFGHCWKQKRSGNDRSFLI